MVLRSAEAEAEAQSASSPRSRVSRRAALLGGGTAVGLAALGLGLGPASAISGPTTARRQLVRASISVEQERDEDRQFLGLSELNPTGFYLAPDQELTITVEANSASKSTVAIGAPDAPLDPPKLKPRD